MVLMTTDHRERHLNRQLMQMLRVEELKGVLRDFSTQFGGKRQTQGNKAVLVARIATMVQSFVCDNQSSKLLTALRIMNQYATPERYWIYAHQNVYNIRLLPQEERSRFAQNVLDATRSRAISSSRVAFSASQSPYSNIPSRPTPQQLYPHPLIRLYTRPMFTLYQMHSIVP